MAASALAVSHMPSPDVLRSGTEFVLGVPRVPLRSVQSGLPNPYGVGASAFEPQTEIYSPGTDPLMRGSSSQLGGYDAVDKKKDEEAAAAALAKQSAAAAGAAFPNGPTINGHDGSVASIIAAAKSLLGKPYVWGGTTANGVDCSGLLYYAFNQAGVKMPRYRASDYGKMGMAVSSKEARAGDIVYYDEPGSTDHVGIYLGNGLMIDSPTSGKTVEIIRVWGAPTYRRVLSDNAFGTMATASGTTTTSYAGQNAGSLFASGYVGSPFVGATVPNYTAGLHLP